jgi:UDP-glucose 6-dehydrogenase
MTFSENSQHRPQAKVEPAKGDKGFTRITYVPDFEKLGMSGIDADNYEMLRGCDALLVVTEWPEFRTPNFEKIRGLLKSPVVFDGRNLYDPTKMRALGFTYRSIGRGAE